MIDESMNYPVLPLDNKLVMPGMIVHFDLSDLSSIRAMERAMSDDREVFAVAKKTSDKVAEKEDLYEIGTICRVKQLVRLPRMMVRVVLEGEIRGRLNDINYSSPFIDGDVTFLEDVDIEFSSKDEPEAMTQVLLQLFNAYVKLDLSTSKETLDKINKGASLTYIVNQIINQIPYSFENGQRLLEAIDVRERYNVLSEIMAQDVNVIKIKSDLMKHINEQMNKRQKESVLREQIKIIREELGDTDSDSQIEELRKRTEELEASPLVKEKITKEIGRLSSSGFSSVEAGVIREYVETLLSLPWDKMSSDNTDLKNARRILEEDHYGLDKIKERVLEFLAVRALKKKGAGPILCLVGPPGTGKTSIAKSIARALEKRYVRISLGGVADEAEIRGHRRTYVAAMPGRIVQGIKQAGVKNPLFLLDEIDKVGRNGRGDVASALLEVLDPEQNVRFDDHYIDIPIDLSQVLFIATANDEGEIPRPLYDRMEIIQVSSYTENEKFHIAKEHLVAKQMDANGIQKKQVTISDGALKAIISSYTREAGVRQLERMIGKIMRKSALLMQEENETKISVSPKNLDLFLGKKKYSVNKANKKPEIGIVRGLAWTSVGGETLEIEVNIMPGKGEFNLTGQLGDVMKESAQAGISYIRSQGQRYHIDEEFFTKNDIHIHIPEGAVPKDGPSAGVTMTTAMLSAITKRPVDSDVAMTGEITLRGRILPIGGLKEKLLAANNAGLKKIFVPFENERDVEEISQEIKEGLDIRFVKNIDQILKEALI